MLRTRPNEAVVAGCGARPCWTGGVARGVLLSVDRRRHGRTGPEGPLLRHAINWMVLVIQRCSSTHCDARARRGPMAVLTTCGALS